MKRRKFLLREEAGDGSAGGGGLNPSRWANPEGAGANAAGAAAEEGSQGAAPAEGAAGAADGAADAFVPNSMWTDLQAVEGFKMPEGITKENEFQLLKQALVDNKIAEADPDNKGDGTGAAAGDAGQSDPFASIEDADIQAYLRYKQVNPDATLGDFVSQRTMFSDMLVLPDREFMAQHYRNEYGIFDAQQNPDGLTEADIEDLVSALEGNKTLTLEAKRYKRAYREHAAKTANVSEVDAQQAVETRRQTAITKIKADTQKLFAETEKITELNGVKLSKTEVSQINKAFEEAILPNDKGEVPIVKMLQSDRILWNFFAVNYLGDEKFKSALFTAGDTTKEQLMKKLGLKPISSTGRQADVGNKNVITPGLWSQPDMND